MTISEHAIMLSVSGALYWNSIAIRELERGEFESAARSFQNAADRARQANIADLHRYYQTGEEHEITPNLSEILKIAAEKANADIIADAGELNKMKCDACGQETAKNHFAHDDLTILCADCAKTIPAHGGLNAIDYINQRGTNAAETKGKNKCQ